jgi:hypothetical protein
MQVFQVSIKKERGDAMVTSYHYWEFLEETKARLQARLEAGEIYYYKVVE